MGFARHRRFPHIHPAEQHAAPIGRGERLRRIEIVPGVQLAERLAGGECLPWLPVAQQVAALETVTVMVAVGGQPLRRKHQQVAFAQREEVRAFPHISFSGGLRARQHALECPGTQIVRAVKANLAQLVFLGADHHPPLAVLLPDFGIAKVLDTLWRQQHRAMFDEVHAVAAGGQALNFAHLVVIARFAQPDVAGVDQRQHAAIVYRAAGETAVFIELIARRQRDRLMLPVDQIVAGGMAPVHRPPVRIKRVVLIKRVVHAVDADQAVGIVNPAGLRRQVKTWIIIILALSMQGFNGMIGGQ